MPPAAGPAMMGAAAVGVAVHALIDNLAGNHAEMTAIRRDIHAHHELGFEEHRTSDLFAKKLID